MSIIIMSKRVLIIDDEENMLHMLRTLLVKEGYEITTATNGREGIKMLDGYGFDAILCDLRMPEMDGMAFLEALKERKIEQTVIMMSAYGTIDLALKAMKRGAYDYISKPFKPDEIVLTLKKAEERERLRRENSFLRNEIKKEFKLDRVVTQNRKMLQIFRTIAKIADYKTSVLITGESGTGKELIAKAIHYNSKRNCRPFVAINCGAIPESLLETELFGHEGFV